MITIKISKNYWCTMSLCLKKCTAFILKKNNLMWISRQLFSVHNYTGRLNHWHCHAWAPKRLRFPHVCECESHLFVSCSAGNFHLGSDARPFMESSSREQRCGMCPSLAMGDPVKAGISFFPLNWRGMGLGDCQC